MKKILSVILALAMCAALFAACSEKPAEEPKVEAASVADAKALLYSMYKDEDEMTRTNFKRVGQIKIGKDVFTVTWSSDNETVKFEEIENKQVSVTIPEKGEEEIAYTITATIADAAGATETVSFTRKVPALPPKPAVGAPTVVETPVKGTAYKLGLNQANLEKTLYFAGKMSGNYFATTEVAMNAVDVYLEEVEGGVRFYFMDGGNKMYLDIHEYQAGKAGVRLTAEPTAVFVYNETVKRYTANVAGAERYLGTYSTYNTISASEIKYISGDKAADVGVSQFPADFYSAPVSYTAVEQPVKNTAYKFALRQENIQKDLYFAGKMSGNYLATTENAVAAVDVYLEEVEGGVRFYFMDGGNKTYIDIHEYQAGKAGVRLTTEPTAVFVYNETVKRYTANVAGAERYLGTYSTYNTISASEIKYISGDKAADVGVSQFPAEFRTINFVNKVVETPVKNTAYKFALEQVNLQKNLYFAGKMSGSYFATTENAYAATDVYMEEVEGGVRFYFMDGEVKTYIDIHEYQAGKAGVRLTAEPTAVFVYNETVKRYTANVAGAERYLGTYSTYNTISASDIKYISGDKAADVGVSQFPANFVIADIG